MKSEAITDTVGESNMSPPSFHVIMVLLASVPLKVMKGLSAGTAIFSLIKPQIQSNEM